MKKWLVTLSMALTVAAGSALAAGDPEAGKAKSTPCSGCHGVDGNSVNPVWPKLAGQHAGYIESQLAAFKGGTRQDPLMAGQAMALEPQDMADLAAYFASQQPVQGSADPAQLELGQRIYRAGDAARGIPACTGCHGPAGAGNGAAKFPALASQHAPYVEKALKDFRGGTRANDMNAMMRGVAKNMTDAEIAAVAQFIQGLAN